MEDPTTITTEQSRETLVVPLSSLRTGTRAQIIQLSSTCKGAERKRLLDLGFVPETIIEVAMVSPSGDPTAYRIRGTQIALRKEQAGFVLVQQIDI